jgi:hypothetical protein
MGLFGASSDPKDEMIALLRDQLALANTRIAELEKLNTALCDVRAHAMNYPREIKAREPQKPEPSPLDPYKPKASREEIEKSFERKN